MGWDHHLWTDEGPGQPKGAPEAIDLAYAAMEIQYNRRIEAIKMSDERLDLFRR